jgi:hypothetical protein
MADRADWDAATRYQRHLAVAADTELRRRHPARNCCAPPSLRPPPKPGATASPSRRGSRSSNRPSGSGT